MRPGNIVAAKKRGRSQLTFLKRRKIEEKIKKERRNEKLEEKVPANVLEVSQKEKLHRRDSSKCIT